MNKFFTDESWADYVFWQENDKRFIKRINELIKEIERSPFTGIGKPEPLKHHLSGYWSRRINEEHRLIYRVEQDRMIILSCRYHY
ncbi:MAG: Txe/YoeB family addiction module toxin [Hafnia alvei]|jgi:toxin YoeB|uniref:Toxin YoeB n=1 Tax=Hafnia alvei TaxID=569 RepID=A0ABD7Q6Y9_HAFAL|nr:Txe/YoeB family addiction module toxin [Hafnia alvei]NEY28009.1 Txe/YoeB family addiction module toxin [Escherichia coli]KAA0262616.1 Txe/YoeB family addiction module toxin [Hafnia alvei]MBI0276609.1 Txe/YoeB family addiction module toxin [Hafnia alvei]MCE9873082.1 Txe/YoeB family addiction module toxin [Hafnia alvei]PNK97498.1 Txe/YoeB family addiction module toxin [Hafnia alvei]